ncbi:MAG: hypothetical protein H3C47_10420 [Candidatus Cloacimonetes bacterium]|nr:hypothetical protein [Candidatus Cloacimonadota bacterium]
MKTPRILHLVEESWPNRLGGVECFVDSLHRDLGFESTVLDYRQIYPEAQTKSRESWRLIQSLASWHDIELPYSDLIVFHQIIPWGIPWMLKQAKSRPCIFVVHDWFFLCQKVHLLKDGKQCFGPELVQCAQCWGSGQNLFWRLGYQAARNYYTEQMSQKIPLAVTQDSFFEKIPQASMLLPYGVSASRSRMFQEFYKNEGEDLVYLGSDARHKGFDILLKELQDSEFVKNGAMLHWYGERKNRSGELPLWVRHHGGLVDFKEGYAWKALILPSLWLETGPLVLLEALSACLPVLAKKGCISSEYANLNGVHQYQDSQDLMHLLKMSRTQLWETSGRVMPMEYEHVLEQHRKVYLNQIYATL